MIHCFKLCGYNIVLDVASGSIHSVDEVAYDVIRDYKDTYEGKDREERIRIASARHAGVSVNDITELFADIEMLKSRGKLFSPDTFADAAGRKHDTPVSALCMNVSHTCNMYCSYCFAGRGEYGSGGDLMSYETGTRAINFLIENSGVRKNLDVDFFGGEPLLNWETVKQIVAYARQIERKIDKKFRFTLTTNGLLIDDDVIDFTNREIHNVVLSLDGRPDVHNKMRKQPGGDGSYSEVVGNINKLVEARRGKGYYIRGTFTRENMDFVNDILHIASLGYKELSMEPVVTKSGEPYGFTQDDLPELFKQYETLAVEMLRLEKYGRGFNFYHFNLDLIGGPCIYKRIAGCGVGTEYLAVTPSGELYPCHQFIGDTRFLMGDVWRGVINKKQRDEFSGCSIYSRSQCRDCWARFYCSGGCAANAYYSSGNVSGTYELGCELFKKRIECAIMMNVARGGDQRKKS